MYIFSLSDGFATSASNPQDYVSGIQWSATTPDVTPPAVTASNPVSEQTGVPISSPDFSMVFSEDIVVNKTFSATLHLVSGVQVAQMSASVPYGVIPATFTRKRRIVQNTLVLKTVSSLILTPSTRYLIKIPKGMVTDKAGNSYIGKTLCSGCDWAFTTSTSQAPTIVGSPGALCNNTIEPGVVAVTPYVGSENVPMSTSSISFRWCDSVKVGTTGFISVKSSDGDVTVTGLDVSKPWTEVMTMSTTQPGKNDTFTIDFANNALGPLTTYTVTIQEGTFISTSGEKNAHYQWDFTTSATPPPIALKSTWPIDGTTHNKTDISYVAVTYNDTVFVGKKGNITVYWDSGTGYEGFEKILSTDVSDASTVTFYKTSQSRRAMGEAPYRRGVSTVAETLKCVGSCVTTDGPTVKLQVPKPGIINDGQRYQGSIEKGAVTGSFGQHGPKVTKQDWNFQTLSDVGGVGFNNPARATAAAAANTAGASSASGSKNSINFAALIAAMCALLVASVGAAGAYVVANRKQEEEEIAEDIAIEPSPIPDLDEISDDEDGSSDPEVEEAMIINPEQKLGDAPGQAAKGYDGNAPVLASAIPSCIMVGTLNATVSKINDTYAEAKAAPPEDEDEDGEDPDGGDTAVVDVPGETADGPGKASKPPPPTVDEALRKGLLMLQAETNPNHLDIMKADIKTIADGIKTIEQLANPKGKKPNKWKIKSHLAALHVQVAKMEEMGEALPCVTALHAASKSNDVTPQELSFLAAQAWPEVTRLRIERAARVENVKLLDAVSAKTRGDMDEPEMTAVMQGVNLALEQLGDEARILDASCKLGCLTALAAKVVKNPEAPAAVESKDDDVGIEMNPMNAAGNDSMLNTAQALVDKHKDFMLQAASDLSGGYTQLNTAIAKIKAINTNPEEDPTVDQINNLQRLIKEFAAPCIDLHARSQSVAAPILEKMLVACQRTATGDSSAYYLQAVIEEIQPQIERLKEKESEAEEVASCLGNLANVLGSKKDNPEKERDIEKLLNKNQSSVEKMLHGHKARYTGWSHETPMTPQFRQPVSKSPELAVLSAIVATLEGVCARPTEDAMIHANSEVKKKYRPTPIKKGDPEKFARALVAMERFAHQDEGADVAFLEAKIQEMKEPLERHREDLRVNITGLSTVFDLCEKIIRRSAEDPDYFDNADQEKKNPSQRLKAKFKAAVFDAWHNVTTLQAERHSNGQAKTCVQQLEALMQADDVKHQLDEFTASVQTARDNLNRALEEDKDLHNERLLLKSMADLQNVNDPDAINVATRETKSQLENIAVVQRNKDALKDVHASFKQFLEGDEAEKQKAKLRLREQINEYAEIVIHLQALEADAAPLRSSLIMAAMILDGTYKPDEVEFTQQQIISPAVMLHCSLPESTELKSLMATINEIVDGEKETVTVKQQVEVANRKTKGFEKIQEAMDTHRAQLTWRSRNAFKKRAEENVDLRPAEKTGAEWDGFHVEDVDLKSWEDTRTPCEKAFDNFDINKDGVITIQEVIDYLLTVKPEERPKGLEDVNPFNKAKMKKRLQKMDTDRDGNLSFEEFSTWWESNEAAGQ
jgi:hypothetical protein